VRVVIDTNVFVSSFFGGNPRKVIDLWRDGKITICLSGPILEEYVAVLRRIGLEGETELEELLSLFGRGHGILFTAKTPELKVVESDPDDDKFIECAVALKADAMVTGDKAIENIGSYMGVKVFNPRDFMELHGGS
jgi:putative PIN family toxin of toxin-antitoxin system